jgi:hypothetical protein
LVPNSTITKFAKFFAFEAGEILGGTKLVRGYNEVVKAMQSSILPPLSSRSVEAKHAQPTEPKTDTWEALDDNHQNLDSDWINVMQEDDIENVIFVIHGYGVQNKMI